MIGLKRISKIALILIAIAVCMGSAVRRLIYIEQHFTLKSLMEHEKNN